MGRRGITVEDDARWVFNRLADDYRARPGYPPSVIGRLFELADRPAPAFIDVGAGTGLVALPLAALGATVFAVEPARAMLEVLRESPAANLIPVHATAEDTRLAGGCADAAVVADALHWLDAVAAGAELGRTVRPGGVVAVVEARFAATPFMASIAALVEAANFKARPQPLTARREQLLRGARVERWSVEAFHASEPLAPERLDRVLRSLSLVGPALGRGAVEQLLADARKVASSHGNPSWERDIVLTWGRTRRAGS